MTDMDVFSFSDNLSSPSKKAFMGIGFFGFYLIVALISGVVIGGIEIGVQMLLFGLTVILYSIFSLFLGSFWFLFNIENMAILHTELLTMFGLEASIMTLTLFYPIIILASLINLIIIIAIGSIFGTKILEFTDTMKEKMKEWRPLKLKRSKGINI